MNKHISTAAAAVALLGAIGFASAQSDTATDPAVQPAYPASAATDTSATPPATTAAPMDNTATPATPVDTSVTPSTTPSADTTMTTERAPQADRG